MIDYVLIGSRLKEQRDSLGLTQERVSEQAGITPVYLSKIENGKVHPTLEALHAICEVLQLELSEVFGGTASESVNYQNETVVNLFRKCSPSVKPIAVKLLEDLSRL